MVIVRTAAWLRRRVGRRGAALLFFGLLDATYCYGLLSPPRPLTAAYAWPQEVMPLWAWALCWGAVSVLCLTFAFAERDTAAFVAAVALKVAWGLLAGLGWVAGAFERGWLAAVIWLAFAAFVHLIAGGIPAAPPSRGRRMWTRA